MLLLIRDLDNPFDYSGPKRTGTAEVSLVPVERLQERLAGSLENR
jgi:hypothetical protein